MNGKPPCGGRMVVKMNFAALRYEELALNAFPVLHTEVYDGWILRFSSGADFRGNCVMPLYLSTRAYEDKITYCEEKFSERSLPCVFKMTTNVASSLDQQLAMRGYEMTGKTRIMECRLDSYEGVREAVFDGNRTGAQTDRTREGLSIPDGTQITLSHRLERDWLEAFLYLDGMDEKMDPDTARAMLEAIRNPVYCAAVYEEGRIVGCGLGVMEDGKMGLYDIRVKSEFRRLGIGGAICRAMMDEGKRNGLDTVYLQVSASNRPAAALYEGLGFTDVYTCWYRVKEPPECEGI